MRNGIAFGEEWTMILDLSEIARTAGASHRHIIDLSVEEIEDIKLTAPISGSININSTGNVLLLNGEIDTEVELTCNRCGINYQQPLHAEIEEDFMINSPQERHDVLTVEEDDDAPDTRLFNAGTVELNLDELIRQSVLLAIPIKPLCSEDCPGLCTNCGNPLSEGPCNCQHDDINPRMAILQKLLEGKELHEN